MLPSLGCHDVSSAKLNAVNRDMSAAMNMETMRAEPAKPAAMPVTTKIPPPIMAPTLTEAASNKLKEGLSSDGRDLSLSMFALGHVDMPNDLELCFLGLGIAT